jgi:hypothetical protein
LDQVHVEAAWLNLKASCLQHAAEMPGIYWYSCTLELELVLHLLLLLQRRQPQGVCLTLAAFSRAQRCSALAYAFWLELFPHLIGVSPVDSAFKGVILHNVIGRPIRPDMVLGHLAGMCNGHLHPCGGWVSIHAQVLRRANVLGTPDQHVNVDHEVCNMNMKDTK